VAREKLHPTLPETALTLVAARFRALGDPSRLKIVNRLMNGELGVQDLLHETRLSQTNLSRHLGVLRQAGILERRSVGNRAFYRIGDPTLVEVCRIVCGSLAEQLAEDLEGFEGTGS
jgi:DNA-binding transcriptional ArsR family regulator